MTFDIEKARETCHRLPKYMIGACPSKEEAEAAKMLPVALDEIERQAKRIAELEKKGDETSARFIECVEKAGKILSRNRKQRAALNKLGKAKRARGKALVEERANLIEAGGESVKKKLLEDDQKELDDLARDQLRQEGKL